MDSQNDGFEDILPDKVLKQMAPCTIGCSEFGRHKSRRVGFVFRIDRLDPDAAKILQDGPRFSIAFNPIMGAIRIKADPAGRYELAHAPLGKGKTFLMWFPFPKSGMTFCTDRLAVEPDANLEQKAILIDLPAPFRPVKPKQLQLPPSRPVARDVTASIMGDPPPGRSALSQRDPEDDQHQRKLLGLTDKFPNDIGGQHFTRQEAALIEVLFRREFVSRYSCMVATHDPANGEDEREEKIIDVLVCKVRPRLKKLGIEISTKWGDGFEMPLASKAKLRALLKPATAEAEA